MEADSALNAHAKPFIPGKSSTLSSSSSSSSSAFTSPLLAVPPMWFGKGGKKNQKPLATIPEQETASATPLIVPIALSKEKLSSDALIPKMDTEINMLDSSKEQTSLSSLSSSLSSTSAFSLLSSPMNADGIGQMNTWNDHCLYLGMCGMDPQSMVPKGLMTKIEDSKTKRIINREKEHTIFAQLMSQLPSLGFGSCNLPDALAEMHNLVTPMEGMSWNWNVNMNVNTNTNMTTTNLKPSPTKHVDKGHSGTTRDPIKEMSTSLDRLTWDNMESSVMECSVAPIYHPQTLYRAAQKAHRSVLHRKAHLSLYCDFLVQLSNNWPSFSFGPNDKGFDTFYGQLTDDMKQKYERPDMTGVNLDLTLGELSLETIGNETSSSLLNAKNEKKNISLISLCMQLSLGFVLYSNQNSKSYTQWSREINLNLAFITELYFHQCLDFNRIHLVIMALMDKNEEWAWAALCEILTCYGNKLESTQGTFIQAYFDRIRLKCQMKPQYDSEQRIQAMLTQIMEFRENAWQKKKRPSEIPKVLAKEPHAKHINNNGAVNKSYASLVKTNLGNNAKKRLHVITKDEKNTGCGEEGSEE